MSESLPKWDAYLKVASISDVGMRRSNNQDNLTVSLASSLESWQRKGHLFIVADGMGAHAAGELASKLAVDHIPHLYAKYDDIPAPEALRKSVAAANTEINRRGQANEDFHNMGTTCCALSILPQGAVVAHVGDSRVYRVRQNRLEQLTFDHSLVWEMRASGQLTEEEEALGKIPKNVITRSLGPYPDCKVDLEGPFPVEVGDLFLMCSDGLTGLVNDQEIGAITANLEPSEAVRVLVDLANLRGGSDNITIIIVQAIHQQIATHPQATGFRVNNRSPSGVNPLTWAVLGVSLLTTALLFFLSQNPLTALIPGAVVIGSIIWLIVQLAMMAGGSSSLMGSRRYGKAPYTRTDFARGDSVTKQLADVIRQLKESAVEQKWTVDWSTLKSLIAQAEEASNSGDHPSAVRNYGRAISFLMDQLRNQGDASSSSIDL